MNRSPHKDDFKDTAEGMVFSSAMDVVLAGGKVRRRSWKDRGVYITVVDERLVIFSTEDELFHSLIVSTGDLAGTDWEVVEEVTGTVH